MSEENNNDRIFINNPDLGYEKYKTMRDGIWQMYIDYSICELPVDVEAIAANLNVKVYSYPRAKDMISHFGLDGYISDKVAIALYTDRWYLLYNSDTQYEYIVNFALAHELGRILMRQKFTAQKAKYFTVYYSGGYVCSDGFSGSTDAQDSEAAQFAARLLAPSAVLWGLGVTDAEEILRLTGLPERCAISRAERMEVLMSRGAFLKSPLEKKAFDGFKDFIDKNKF